MAHFILNPERNKAIEAIQKAEYERKNPSVKPMEKIYSDMQSEVNRMINKDSKLRNKLGVKPR